VRRLLIPLLGVGLVVVLVIGLTQAGNKTDEPAAATKFDLQAAQRKLEGSPPALAALHANASKILDGGFQQQLDKLKGRPVVINKWASWCVPCRAEFPMLESTAARRGTTVAFVGVNGSDKRPAAAAFLRQRPLPYPSYEDPHESISRAIEAPANYPITVFLDRRGHTAFIHPGSFRSEAELNADIDRYLQP
jgi:cytochrome c biogenesis protein CcmG, thiol:disulfide interchange protein DsbE